MTKIDIDELLKILPNLIRENDTVKGAIITALSGVVATRQDILDLINVMDKRFNEQQRSIKELSVSIMRIEYKEGELLQDAVLDLMKETLVLQQIDPKKIRRETLTDPEGEIFYKNYTTDIDVLLENDNTYLVEVKATVGSQDIAHFLQNVKLYELRRNKKITRPILVTLRITRNSNTLAEQKNIKVIAGGFLD